MFSLNSSVFNINALKISQTLDLRPLLLLVQVLRRYLHLDHQHRNASFHDLGLASESLLGDIWPYRRRMDADLQLQRLLPPFWKTLLVRQKGQAQEHANFLGHPHHEH